MTAILRAKMRVNEVIRYIDQDGEIESEQVKLSAVYEEGESENAQWAKWTPSAAFTITINNPEAIGGLSKGHQYFVDFIPAEE